MVTTLEVVSPTSVTKPTTPASVITGSCVEIPSVEPLFIIKPPNGSEVSREITVDGVNSKSGFWSLISR